MRKEYKEPGGYFNYKKAGQFFSHDQWSALQALFLDGPWHRVWIMRELACAPGIVLTLGDKTMDWNISSSFLDHDHFPDAYHSAFGHASNGPSGILDGLLRFKSTGATDPRDKIYALIGLATNGPKIVVDYTKPVKEVYVNFFAKYVSFTQNLDLLCQSPWGFPDLYGPYIAPRRSRPDVLPSWWPDFDRPRGGRLLFDQRGIFCAGGPTCTTPCRITDFSKLVLPGICLGELIEGGNPGFTVAPTSCVTKFRKRHSLIGMQLPSMMNLNESMHQLLNRFLVPSAAHSWQTAKLIRLLASSPQMHYRGILT
ncbi:hypothetical protein LTR66_004217 [Elasticomyces elasticus]|nr:hypothetical protein LTR66_004217 [Elasticomyces elasticus]